jgi:hypothetical protein
MEFSSSKERFSNKVSVFSKEIKYVASHLYMYKPVLRVFLMLE